MRRLTTWMARTVFMLGISMGMSVAGAAEVLLGASDVVRLSVYGSPDLSAVSISSAGTVRTVTVGGQSVTLN